MAHLTARRSPTSEVGMLSVVYLAILYAVLTIALGFEWGRILERLATDAASYDAVAEGSEVDPSGSLR